MSEALQKAQSALSIIEQLELLLTNLTAFSSQLNKLHRDELEVYISQLKSLISALDDNPEDLDLLHFKPLTAPLRSKIERLKLGGEIVRLREKGYTINEISAELGLQGPAVSRFLKYYDQAKPSEKAKIHRISIFDTANQFEEIAATIYRMMARLENNGEVHVKYIAELRQVIVAAQKFMEQVSDRLQMEKIKEAVIAILIEELPEKRETILKRFGELNLTSSFNPQLKGY